MKNNYWTQVGTVTLWEFKRFFKWKQDLASYFVLLTILFVIGIWQKHIADDNNQVNIAVQNSIQLPENDRFKLTYFYAEELETKQTQVGEEFDAVVYLKEKNVFIFVEEKAKWLETFKSWMSESAQSDKLEQAGISGEELKQIITPYTYQLRVKGEEYTNKDKSNAALMIMILLMVGVFTAFAYVFVSITTEKQQRVTEQLLSTMSAQTWMDGKILGITLMCFKSLITASLSMLIFSQVMSIINQTAAATIEIEIIHILALVVFMVLGLLMWNSILAGFAATIDDPNQSSRSILMLIPAVPIFLAYSLADAPQSITMQVLSYFPLTSFAAMPIRMAEATIPGWQIVISISLLIAAIYTFRKAAARLFNMGVMMYGKEPGFKEMMTVLLKRV